MICCGMILVRPRSGTPPSRYGRRTARVRASWGFPAAFALFAAASAAACASSEVETGLPRLSDVEEELKTWREAEAAKVPRDPARQPDAKQPDAKAPDLKPPDVKPPDPRRPDTQVPDVKPPIPDPKPPDRKAEPPPREMSPQEIAQAYKRAQPIVSDFASRACVAVDIRARKLTNMFERGMFLYMTQRYAEAYQLFQERVKRDNSSSNRSRDGNNPNVSGQTDIWLAKLATLVSPADERTFSYWLDCANKIRVDKGEVEYYTQKWRPYWVNFGKEYPAALARARTDPDELWKLIETFYGMEEYERNHPLPHAIWRLQHLAEMHLCFPDHPKVADGTCADRLTETLSLLYLDQDAADIAKEFIAKRPENRMVKSGDMLWRLCGYLQGAGKYEEAIEKLREFQKSYPKHWANQTRRHHNDVLPPPAQEKLDQCIRRWGQR
ncbi:MAG: hypothetical protein N3A38_06675 [Planctomycetota bacterium]|nr:hypothetical protein [Planctomycetota bacterium]